MSAQSQEHLGDRERALLPTLLASQLEAALNHALTFAPGTQKAMANLADKRIALKLTAPKAQLFLQINDLQRDDAALTITSYSEEKPHVTLRGPLFSVIKQLGFNTTPGKLLSSDVTISGETAIAQQLAALIREHDFDIEEPLSRIVGDVAAHQIGTALKSAGGWLQRAGRAMLDSSTHYVRDEAKLSIPKQEFQHFATQVDETRNDVDRLQARIERLKRT